MRVHYWHLRYIDDDSNHRKFYRVFQTPQGVLLQWGRIGSQGQVKFDDVDERRADLVARRQVFEKLAKGYDFVEEGEFDSWEPPFRPGHEPTDRLNHLLNELEEARSQGILRTDVTIHAAIKQLGDQATALLNSTFDEDTLREILILQGRLDAVRTELDRAQTAVDLAKRSLTARAS